jgi:hypothetical protein
MKRNLLVQATWLLAALVPAGAALADCAADSTAQDVRAAYARGQSLEKAGRAREALAAYGDAQAYVCDGNPVESQAAQRAAVVAEPLATAAAGRGDRLEAFRLYDAGGHFAAADRELMAYVRARPDDPAAYAVAYDVFEDRRVPSFQVNNAARIAAAGPYAFDRSLLEALLPMPAQAFDRALQKEAGSFSEQYLREAVQLAQSAPSTADMDAWQRAAGAQQAFAAKWSGNPLQASIAALDLAHEWTKHVRDEAERSALERRRSQRAADRAQAILDRFNGSPALFEPAMDYIGRQGLEHEAHRTRVAGVKALADRLGDEAAKAGKLPLAVEYFSVADQPAKAQAARDRMSQLAKQQMAPSIEQAQQQAEELRRQYGDPAQVEAMKRDAEATRRALQEQQAAGAAESSRKADELADELGI